MCAPVANWDTQASDVCICAYNGVRASLKL
jgi:hypothetical protein